MGTQVCALETGALWPRRYSLADPGGALAGDIYWAWGGEARPPSLWTGDPPHETPGWFFVYDADTSTLGALAAHADETGQ
ncbi:MAG: hypothetical protein JW940_26435 [Polyangiaceae bacterium]|nr:hypothetical protein [Polyangiaceae bacterium]